MRFTVGGSQYQIPKKKKKVMRVLQVLGSRQDHSFLLGKALEGHILRLAKTDT